MSYLNRSAVETTKEEMDALNLLKVSIIRQDSTLRQSIVLLSKRYTPNVIADIYNMPVNLTEKLIKEFNGCLKPIPLHPIAMKNLDAAMKRIQCGHLGLHKPLDYTEYKELMAYEEDLELRRPYKNIIDGIFLIYAMKLSDAIVVQLDDKRTVGLLEYYKDYVQKNEIVTETMEILDYAIEYSKKKLGSLYDLALKHIERMLEHNETMCFFPEFNILFDVRPSKTIFMKYHPSLEEREEKRYIGPDIKPEDYLL